MNDKQRILIIEDDPNIADVIEIHLKDLDYLLDRATDGPTGLEMARRTSYPLIILDIMLPGLSGLEICRQLRSERIETPILMLTAKSEELDKVLGLEFGADDYLTKPFSVRELIARVKAILRRVEVEKERYQHSEEAALDFGELHIDLLKKRVMLAGSQLELTPKELELLILFMRNPGRIYSRQDLLDMVWGYQYSGYDHTVNSHINRLRNKIETDPANPKYIRTLWGLGYRFAELEEIIS